MGLDLYAGPLCRYYAEDWELSTVAALRKSGINVNVSRPGPIYSASTNRDDILAAIVAWRQEILRQLSDAGLSTADWLERYDAPYLTDKPDEDGIDAFRVFVAYTGLGLREMPAELPLDVNEDAAVKKFFDYGGASLLRNIELQIEYQAWIPVEFRGAITHPPMPNGFSYFIGSVDVLFDALAQINLRTWKASAADIRYWHQRGPLGKGTYKFGDKKLNSEPQKPDVGITALEHAAQYGFAVLMNVTDWAKQQRMPMIVDV